MLSVARDQPAQLRAGRHMRTARVAEQVWRYAEPSSETSEALGNVSGGINRGPEYDGLTQAALQFNTQKALHWYGGTFNVSALQIHGQNLSQDNLATLQTASGIEADRATRLWELWYDQKFDREGKYDMRVRAAEPRPGVHGQPERL
jgi:hypothetical protein